MERLVRDSFPQGGQWEMSVMEKGEPGAVNTHWHSHINADRRFLCLGGQRPLSVENQAQDITFRPLLHYMYPTD